MRNICILKLEKKRKRIFYCRTDGRKRMPEELAETQRHQFDDIYGRHPALIK